MWFESLAYALSRNESIKNMGPNEMSDRSGNEIESDLQNFDILCDATVTYPRSLSTADGRRLSRSNRQLIHVSSEELSLSGSISSASISTCLDSESTKPAKGKWIDSLP